MMIYHHYSTEFVLYNNHVLLTLVPYHSDCVCSKMTVIVTGHHFAIGYIVFCTDPVMGYCGHDTSVTWQTSEMWLKQSFVTYRNHVMVVQIHIIIDFVLYKNHVMAT